MEKMFKILNSIYPMSEGLRDYIASHLKSVKLPKKHLLLKPEQVSDKMYFVEFGLLRGYYLHDGKEVTTWIMQENEMVISILSFYTQQPAQEYIELLEDCKLWYMSYADVQKGYQQFMEFNFIARIFTERYYIMSEYRSFYMRMHTADERLKLLLNDFPTILARVKQKDIASLLGITPETLTRKLANKI